MKKFVIITVLMAAFAAGSALKAQDSQQEYIGLPGDNLNLYAVMRLFQESKTLEDFERNLNDPNSNINNLDLNGDNYVDYIKVFDDVDGDVHNIVLQDAISPRENQDVAVFTVQRFQNGQVQIQLTGDEELYGRNYIIEPIYDDANPGGTPNPGYTDSRSVNGVTVTYVRTTPVQIAAWPLVRFIFLPDYRVWHSNWYWGYYPNYWHPWRPYSWNYYYGYQYNWNNVYYSHYRRWDEHRYSRWNDFYYTGRRSYSSDVKHRIAEGNYKSTYSHPDQRREGEAMFAKSHPSQYRSSGNISTSNSSSATRRQTSTSTMRKNPSNGNNGSTTRRSGTNITDQSATHPSNSNNASTTRRSRTTITNQAATHPSNGNNTSTTRKSGTTVTNQSDTHPSNNNNTSTTRRSSTSVTNRSVNNTSSGQNAADKNTKVRSNTTKTNSSARMSKNKTKSSAAEKKSSASKEKDKKDPIRK